MSDLRILIADDHEIMRRGLRQILDSQNGWRVVAEASTGREAVELATHHKPDLVVLDVDMPELNGLDATRQILRHDPDCPVLALTTNDSAQRVRDVLRSGARGYVLKSDSAHGLITAVEALRQRAPFFGSKVASVVLDEYSGAGSLDEESVTTVELTPREREVVQLLAEGRTNKEVAGRLGISVKTAETHRANIMHKLGFRSLSDLVRYAVRNNIITP